MWRAFELIGTWFIFWLAVSFLLVVTVPGSVGLLGALTICFLVGLATGIPIFYKAFRLVRPEYTADDWNRRKRRAALFLVAYAPLFAGMLYSLDVLQDIALFDLFSILIAIFSMLILGLMLYYWFRKDDELLYD